MDVKKDYYAVLGVLPSAESETIQAVYRSLSKKYRPDVSKQNKAESEKKIRGINEAYEVLSDVSKRNHYDKEREQTGSQHSNFYEEDVDEKIASEYSDPKMDEDWKRISEYYPAIERHRKNLELLSQDLAFTYKAYVISEKVFESSKDFHITFIERILKKIFWSSQKYTGIWEEFIIEEE